MVTVTMIVPLVSMKIQSIDFVDNVTLLACTVMVVLPKTVQSAKTTILTSFYF